MFEKLSRVEERYNKIAADLCDPAVVADISRYTALMKEQKHLTPVVETFARYKTAKTAAEEARELLQSESDPELCDLAREELKDSEAALEQLQEQLKILLLPRDPNDDKNVIIEIRGGAYSRFKFESGVHRVQRVPETESQGRIHTSTVTVAVLPEAEEVDFELDPKDLQIDTFRSSGAGGQHINKTSSAIRITHLPTGTVVECQDERSQHKNKDKAMKVLRARLYDAEKAKHDAAIAGERKSQVGTGDRSERIRTYNYPQGRVTDHRINLTLYRLEQILNGDLDELIDALITADTAAKLSAAEE